MREYENGYEREYSILSGEETIWRNSKTGERCNSYDNDAVSVSRCTCCGRTLYRGERCTCGESKW